MYELPYFSPANLSRHETHSTKRCSNRILKEHVSAPNEAHAVGLSASIDADYEHRDDFSFDAGAPQRFRVNRSAASRDKRNLLFHLRGIERTGLLTAMLRPKGIAVIYWIRFLAR